MYLGNLCFGSPKAAFIQCRLAYGDETVSETSEPSWYRENLVQQWPVWLVCFKQSQTKIVYPYQYGKILWVKLFYPRSSNDYIFSILLCENRATVQTCTTVKHIVVLAGSLSHVAVFFYRENWLVLAITPLCPLTALLLNQFEVVLLLIVFTN